MDCTHCGGRRRIMKFVRDEKGKLHHKSYPCPTCQSRLPQYNIVCTCLQCQHYRSK